MSTVPVIADSVLPAGVRTGTDAQKATYKTALSFERQLVEQLTQQMADTAAPADPSDDDSDDGSGDAGASTGTSSATSTYQQMLPGVLADSIMKSGGLGLAQKLYDQMEQGKA